jgi:tRNA threonylcarbamoyladenosine biosynthesis protein TsaE
MATPLLQFSFTLNTLADKMPDFWQAAAPYRVLAFSGHLGAGKTTFIHALCEYLGVEDAVSSPTFALINEYHFDQSGKDKVIYHMDWYRLRDTEEAINAGMEDALLQPDAWCFVEWPEKATELLPANCLWIEIEVLDAEERMLTAVPTTQ